ncbi:C4-dicarboxylate ABC transporter [Vibrio cholerae]|nr:C4-dicarboxylate ABC transporter [Vibrio cholerae]
MLLLSLVLCVASRLRRALVHASHKPELVFCYGISVQWPFALV